MTYDHEQWYLSNISTVKYNNVYKNAETQTSKVYFTKTQCKFIAINVTAYIRRTQFQTQAHCFQYTNDTNVSKYMKEHKDISQTSIRYVLNVEYD